MKKILLLISIMSFIIILNAEIVINDSLPKINYKKLHFGEKKTLEIVTWNIQTFPKKGEITVDYVAKIILSIDADVYGLQEIEDAESFTKIIHLLNQEDKKDDWEGFRANTDEWKMNLAFIYKKKVIQPKVIYEIFNKDTKENRYAFPRHPLILEFGYKGNKIVLINNHLKAKGGEKNEKRRMRAVRRLDEYIKLHFDNDNVIVIGDMNDQLIDPKKHNVFEDFIGKKDQYKFADEKIAADTTADWSYPYWKYRGHIDHILISNELFDEFANKRSAVKTIAIDKFMEGGDDARYKNISDHRPVAVKLKF